VAKQTVGEGESPLSQATGSLERPRLKAAQTLAAAAPGLLGCNACEIYIYDEGAGAYASIAASSDGDQPQTGAPIDAKTVDDLFGVGSDLVAVDDARSLDDPLKSAAANLGAASLLILRASVERRPLGLIVCAYRWSRHLSAAGVVTPSAFARVAATALDLARRTENALDRADRLAALLDSAARFAGELDLEELFTAIHEEVSRHMDAPSFYVALESGETRELRTEYAIESGMRFHSDALPGREGLAAQVHTSGRPALVEWADVYQAPDGGQDASAGTVLMVPMRLGERIIGVMSAQSKAPNAYNQHHVEFLLEVAEQAATAIQNAGVLREERRRMAELTMLHRVAVLTSSEAQLDRIMAAIVVEAAAIFHADAASIALEDEHGDFELAATFGLSEDYRKKRRLPGAMLRALYGEPPKERFVGPDQIQSIGQPELVAAEGIRNDFFIPLVYRGKLVGSLALHGRQGIVRLSPGETHLAQVFADQVAAAMHRAQAALTLAERIEDYDLTARVGRALASNLQADYREVLGILRDQLGYSHLTIFSVEGDPAQLQVRAALGYSQAAAGTRMALDRGLVGLVAKSAEMVYVPDVSAEARYLKVAPEVRSFIAYPLKVENDVLGVLSVESAKVDGFHARDRRVLVAVADQIAVAMSNARLYAVATERLASLEAARKQSEEYARYLEGRQEELKLLGAVGAAVNSTLNLNRMLATAAEKIAAGLHAERCVINLYNEEQTDTEVVADHWTLGTLSAVGARFPIRNDSPALRALRQRQAFASDDAASDTRLDGNRQEILELGLRGCAIAAIASEGQVLGTLMVGDTSGPRSFSQEQLGVLETIATQLALGVRNARLYGRARERANEDSLTGLFNHRYLHGRLDQEIVRSERTGQPLAVTLFDLNNFKAFNDNYGHQAGDEVLRFMATILHQCLRATDIAGRYGGDEFLVILPQSDEHGARLLLDRVRRKIEEQAGAGFLPIPIGLSAGIAVYPRDGASKQELIARADAAMYADKRK
jgi:diguanylate cyclase (GGDEF)-like protein